MLLAIFECQIIRNAVFGGARALARACVHCAIVDVSHMATIGTLRIGYWMTNREIPCSESTFFLLGGVYGK